MEGDGGTAVESHRLTTADGWRLVLRRYPGGGAPVLFVHGMGANSCNFDLNSRYSLARFLAARGFDSWVVELRGRGESRPPDGARRDWNFEDFLHGDLPAVIGLVRQHTGRAVHWVGHSMGGMLGLAYVVCYGQSAVDSLVLFGTPLGFDPSQRALRFWGWMAQVHHLLPTMDQEKLGQRMLPLMARARRALNFFLRYLANPDNIDDNTALDIFRRLVTNEAPGIVLQFSDWVRSGQIRSADREFVYSERLERIRCPVLAISGASDLMAPAEVTARLAAGLKHAAFRQVVLRRQNGFSADYGHGDLTLGKRAPDEVYPLVGQWLAERGPA